MDDATLAAKSQDALKQVVAILDAIKGGTDRNEVFYQIGRATMTAKLAVAGFLERTLCTRCDGDGFDGHYAGNCDRCGGSGKEPEAAA